MSLKSSPRVLRWLPGAFPLVILLVNTSCLTVPRKGSCDLRTVLAYREPSTIAGNPRMFRLYLRSDGKVAEFWRHLGDFEPQWGIEYEIQVTRYRFKTVLGPGRRDEAMILRATERPGQEFRMHSFGRSWLGPDGRSFIDGQSFVCATEELCTEIDSRLFDELARVDLVCRLPARLGGPVVIIAVEQPSCKYSYDCEWPQVCCMNLGTWRGTCRGTRNPPVNNDWPPRWSSATCRDCHDSSVQEEVTPPPRAVARPCEQ